MRADQLLVLRQHASSRSQAQRLIEGGLRWRVGEVWKTVTKNGDEIPLDAELQLQDLSEARYVSRGGLKLEAALLRLKLSVSGWACLDVGQSTGGFTDCLLQAGAVRVYAIDSGTNQLDWRLRSDPRVVVREGVNARHMTAADLGEFLHLAVCDVSFISATRIVPVMAATLKPDSGEMVVLVKPQFEVARGMVGEGGIVRDPLLHEECCQKVRACVEQLGFETDIMESPITGAEGNKEFLLYGRRITNNSQN